MKVANEEVASDNYIDIIEKPMNVLVLLMIIELIVGMMMDNYWMIDNYC